MNKSKPLLLLILDGWGHRQDAEDNAIHAARTPVWDRLWNDYPHTLIATCGAAVGLPPGQMGNSEVGHMNLGAGRVVYQDFTRIGRAIECGELFDNRVLGEAMDRGRAVHVLGLLSPGGVHSHEQHLQALAEMAVQRGAEQVYLHAFLDGRDTPPQSAAESLRAMQSKFADLGRGRIASLIGRYYAMDRDKRWERIEQAYDLLTSGRAEFHAGDAQAALQQAYARGETDEFVKATVIEPVALIGDGDTVIFANFRADRARQLTRAFIDADFDGFTRKRWPELAAFVCMTEYDETLAVPVAFPPLARNASLGEVIARHGGKQLRIAETEKYAHVTFFFNGGEEKPFDGEDRQLIPSPKVATYDLQPEMSAPELTERLVAAIRDGGYDLIVCNYANPDMVGHTGNFAAAVSAVETIDACLGRIVQALQEHGGEMLLSADHGNVEMMRDPQTGQPHTAHTLNPVPLVYLGRPLSLASGGALCDIAPTALALLDLPQPEEMSGHSLLEL